MTEGGELPPGEVRRREASARNRRERAEWAEVEVGGLPDWELIGAFSAHAHDISYPMEIDRRLKVAVEGLTAETVRAAAASDRTSQKLVVLTVVLVVMTAALVALTVVLAVRS
jgi:hypothetical protein